MCVTVFIIVSDHRMILQYQLEKQVGSGVLWCGTTKDVRLSHCYSIIVTITIIILHTCTCNTY